MYESLTQGGQSKSDAPDDLGSMVIHMVKLVPWKSIIFVFIWYVLMNTTTFVDVILGSWSGAVEHRYPTEYGLFIQAIMMALGLAIFSILSNGELI
jgi:hypothetical protein